MPAYILLARDILPNSLVSKVIISNSINFEKLSQVSFNVHCNSICNSLIACKYYGTLNSDIIN
jgi:hypothetical protein